jgi:hypothetical protein
MISKKQSISEREQSILDIVFSSLDDLSSAEIINIQYQLAQKDIYPTYKPEFIMSLFVNHLNNSIQVANVRNDTRVTLKLFGTTLVHKVDMNIKAFKHYNVHSEIYEVWHNLLRCGYISVECIKNIHSDTMNILDLSKYVRTYRATEMFQRKITSYIYESNELNQNV